MQRNLLSAAAALAVMSQGTIDARAAVIDTVYVGDVGNAADPSTGSRYGSVSYGYSIGKYEVTIGQYSEFLNSVAATDTYSLYSSSMGTDLNVAGIARIGSSGSYTYSVMNNGGSSANRPITYVNWGDAARFANWMANDQPVGAQGDTTTENGAYKLNGTNGYSTITKNVTNPNTGEAVSWWIPSENEWYKAAYYDPTKAGTNYWSYPTQSDTAPGNVAGSAGGANYYNGFFSVTQSSSYSSTQSYLTKVGSYSAASHYGTFDQGGNAGEFNSTLTTNGLYCVRGGAWWGTNSGGLISSGRGYYHPVWEDDTIGFRLSSIPEPVVVGMLLLAGVVAWGGWIRKNTP